MINDRAMETMKQGEVLWTVISRRGDGLVGLDEAPRVVDLGDDCCGVKTASDGQSFNRLLKKQVRLTQNKRCWRTASNQTDERRDYVQRGVHQRYKNNTRTRIA